MPLFAHILLPNKLLQGPGSGRDRTTGLLNFARRMSIRLIFSEFFVNNQPLDVPIFRNFPSPTPFSLKFYGFFICIIF